MECPGVRNDSTSSPGWATHSTCVGLLWLLSSGISESGALRHRQRMYRASSPNAIRRSSNFVEEICLAVQRRQLVGAVNNGAFGVRDANALDKSITRVATNLRIRDRVAAYRQWYARKIRSHIPRHRTWLAYVNEAHSESGLEAMRRRVFRGTPLRSHGLHNPQPDYD